MTIRDWQTLPCILTSYIGFSYGKYTYGIDDESYEYLSSVFEEDNDHKDPHKFSNPIKKGHKGPFISVKKKLSRSNGLVILSITPIWRSHGYYGRSLFQAKSPYVVISPPVYVSDEEATCVICEEHIKETYYMAQVYEGDNVETVKTLPICKECVQFMTYVSEKEKLNITIKNQKKVYTIDTIWKNA